MRFTALVAFWTCACTFAADVAEDEDEDADAAAGAATSTASVARAATIRRD
jgi:hypothetical protein